MYLHDHPDRTQDSSGAHARPCASSGLRPFARESARLGPARPRQSKWQAGGSLHRCRPESCGCRTDHRVWSPVGPPDHAACAISTAGSSASCNSASSNRLRVASPVTRLACSRSHRACPAAHDDPALGERHLASNLRGLIPPGHDDRRGDEFDADVVFAEVVHCWGRFATV